jgi:lipid A 3-O-deacylase
MKFCKHLSLLCFLILWPVGHAAAQCTVASIQFENDIGFGGTDRHYTHGSRVSCMSENQSVGSSARDIANAVSFDIGGYSLLNSDRDVRYSVALGQAMFTPEDLTRTDLIADDRPYAGWLFGSVGLVLGPRFEQRPGSTAFDRMESLQLTLGMVGPLSGADRTQKFVHSAIDAQKPRGWRNQLRNEPGFILEYEQKWRTNSWNLLPGSNLLQVDLMPSAGVALGNVHTYGTVAATFRFGNRLANDFGPPRIRPSVAGSEYYEPSADERLGAYLFFSIGGRAVARNIFLDGNSFRSSHSVEKKHFVGDLQFGAVVSLWGTARVSLTHNIRSREFDEQDSVSQFSALSLSFHF